MPTLTAEQNILLPLEIAGRKVDPGLFARVVDTVGLHDRLGHRPPELSRPAWLHLPIEPAAAVSRPRAAPAGLQDKLVYTLGDFPVAEAVHKGTLKLPVWHRESDMPLADSYLEAFRKVTDRYRDLQG